MGNKKLLLSELYGFKSLYFEDPDLKISVFFSDSLQIKERKLSSDKTQMFDPAARGVKGSVFNAQFEDLWIMVEMQWLLVQISGYLCLSRTW